MQFFIITYNKKTQHHIFLFASKNFAGYVYYNKVYKKRECQMIFFISCTMPMSLVHGSYKYL